MTKKKKKSKNAKKEPDKGNNCSNEIDSELTNKNKNENSANANDSEQKQNRNKKLSQKSYKENKNNPELHTCLDENEKKNVYYIFEELTHNKDINSSVKHYTWLYFFENMMLKLDTFISHILNYSYYLLNNAAKNTDSSKNSKRNILLTEPDHTLNRESGNNDQNNFTLNFNNTTFKRIEQIIEHNNDSTINYNVEGKELAIISYLKKQNIKSMIYVNDIFEPQYLSILLLISSTNEKEIFNVNDEQKLLTKLCANDSNKKIDYNELGILKGYDIILVRYSLEIMYFYKNKNELANLDNFSMENEYNLAAENEYNLAVENEYYLVNSSKRTMKKKNKNKKIDKTIEINNKKEKENKIQKKVIIEKSKYPTMITWRNYLNNSHLLNEKVVLDALNVCSGMDGYIDDQNFNFDVLVNNNYSYFVQYKTEISICRLIYAVTSLLKKRIKPIIYIPHWWYYDIFLCEEKITETAEFHLYVFDELKKDGLLNIGYKKKNSLILTMDEKDIDLFTDLATQNDATLCTNNNDIIKYYLNINENAKVSKFISQGTFFVITNFL
ncbi:conserved Plasmodium protein, unknown function [Plasmodium ovale curtisi]|uniref:Uncharacterized protein n=1 Tax=Plasmodium ovale curtisi TaxID=864141 RepID=A0A1A8VU97_PLAOA|nr:conserved Plasmodium protein, unknown function [Plasmodium ovale curtisi]SBS92245.1 conserved Plasmodium protein, unknown function [Plasmodium ovale curtisi]